MGTLATIGAMVGAGAKPAQANPLRFASPLNFGPIGTAPVAVPLAGSVTTPRLTAVYPFIVGSCDQSELVLSFLAWGLDSGGALALGNGYTIEECAIEYAGDYQQVLFSGATTKAIASGDTDIQSDAVPASAFGVSAFTHGAVGKIRFTLSFAAGTTDVMPRGLSDATGSWARLYDPAKVNFTNGVLGIGTPTYAMINGGSNGVDIIVASSWYAPILLGRAVAGSELAAVALFGDSKTRGTGDSNTAYGYLGMSRALFKDVSRSEATTAGCNFGIASGNASDLALATPSRWQDYLQYATKVIEAYGTNQPANTAACEDLHAAFRAAGITEIIRPSLTPRTTSTDSWATSANQTTVTGWSDGGSVDLFEDAMQALVAADLTYFEISGLRGVDHWTWPVTGAAFYSTGDGVHENATGYELKVGATGSVIAAGGTSAGTLRGLVSSLVLPPIISSASSGTATADGCTGASVSTDTGSGTLYWAVVSNGGSATDAQIKAGSGGDIVSGVAGSQAVSGTGTQTLGTITGLTEGVTYQIKFLHSLVGGETSNQDSASLTPSAYIVEFDAVTSSGSFSNAPTVTFSHTASGVHRYVRVHVGWVSSSASTCGVTYGGVAMASVKKASVTSGFQYNSEIFELVNPPTTSESVVATFSGANGYGGAAAISYTGVNQATPSGVTGSNANASATSSSVTIASAVGNMVGDCLCLGSAASAVSGTKTSRFAAGPSFTGRGQDADGAASVAMAYSWTGGAQTAHAAAEIVAG